MSIHHLGVLAATALAAVAAMAQVRAADQAGDDGACERALADVQRAIGP